MVVQSEAGKGYGLGKGKWHRRQSTRIQPLHKQAGREEKGGNRESKQLRVMIFRTKQDERYYKS